MSVFFLYLHVSLGKKILKMKCKRKDDQSIVADKICERGSKKPQAGEPCNTQECTPEYVHITYHRKNTLGCLYLFLLLNIIRLP